MWLKCPYRFHNLLHYIQFYIGTSRWHHSNMCRYYDMDYFHMRWQLKRELKIFKRTIYITSLTWVGDFLVQPDINTSWLQVIFFPNFIFHKTLYIYQYLYRKRAVFFFPWYKDVYKNVNTYKYI